MCLLRLANLVRSCQMAFWSGTIVMRRSYVVPRDDVVEGGERRQRAQWQRDGAARPVRLDRVDARQRGAMPPRNLFRQVAHRGYSRIGVSLVERGPNLPAAVPTTDAPGRVERLWPATPCGCRQGSHRHRLARSCQAAPTRRRRPPFHSGAGRRGSGAGRGARAAPALRLEGWLGARASHPSPSHLGWVRRPRSLYQSLRHVRMPATPRGPWNGAAARSRRGR